MTGMVLGKYVMKKVLQTDTCLIIDNFLSKEDHQFVWTYIQEEKHKAVHTDQWVKAFRLSDGIPMWGPPCLSDKYEPDTRHEIYPTGKGIDIIIKALKAIQLDLIPLIGKQGEDWAYFFARSYLYPRGAGLSWHRDNANNVTGAFVYYAHPKWDVNWGGEFLISDASTKDVVYDTQTTYSGEQKFLGSHLDTSTENKALMEKGFGLYVQPKPNRLVILTSGVIHTIKRVDENAGDNVRSTIQGFFQDPVNVCKQSN